MADGRTENSGSEGQELQDEDLETEGFWCCRDLPPDWLHLLTQPEGKGERVLKATVHTFYKKFVYFFIYLLKYVVTVCYER